jgi:hypothetical protein
VGVWWRSPQRSNTKGERDRVRAVVTDPAVLAGVERYGLAEYLGAGPDAVELYDDGATTCPVGHALVRAAVDWRRAGLARLVPLSELQAALPIYLSDRPDVVCDDSAVEDGLQWATDRINETVALLLPHQPPADDDRHSPQRLYEVFEYLVDVTGARKEAPIPAAMWRRVARAAGAEARDVARAAGWYFAGRSRVLSELASWLAAAATDQPQLLVLTGDPGSGKTAVLTALALLADPSTRNLVQADPVRPRVKLPVIDLQTRASGMTPDQLLRELCAAAGQAAPDNASSDQLMAILLEALSERRRPFVAVVDEVDAAADPRRMAEVVSQIAVLVRRVPRSADRVGATHVRSRRRHHSRPQRSCLPGPLRDRRIRARPAEGSWVTVRSPAPGTRRASRPGNRHSERGKFPVGSSRGGQPYRQRTGSRYRCYR